MRDNKFLLKLNGIFSENDSAKIQCNQAEEFPSQLRLPRRVASKIIKYCLIKRCANKVYVSTFLLLFNSLWLTSMNLKNISIL